MKKPFNGRNDKIHFLLQQSAIVFPSAARQYGQYDFVEFLKNVKTEMKGKKLFLIWDRLPAHRAKIVADYIESQKSWLRVEHYPGYAPELSPVEFMWSSMKGKDLAHIPPKGLEHLKRLVKKSVRRIKSDKHLLKDFLKKAYVLS